jgi:hypothetical protein
MNINQINARVIHKRHNCNLDIIDISHWKDLRIKGFDAVWIMGSWKICEYSATNSQKIYTQYPLESIVGPCFAFDEHIPDSFVGDILKLKGNITDFTI